jgi:type I restriction enzyme S subunit
MVADYVSLTDQKRFTLPLPEITAQRRIADILGSLDDKIELNRRMNATLESLARRLFKSWFVDFDPVHAKAAVRRQHPKWDNDRVSREALPKLDPKIAELFPDEFEESTLGPIPKGWKVCPLSDRLQILSGGTPKTSEPSYWDGDIPWYSVKDAPSETDLWVIDTERHITVLGVENSVTQLLPRGTTIISARGTVGKLALVATPMAMNQSCYGIRGVEDHSGFFTYYALRHAVLELQQRSHGTVFDTITRHTFETLDCISPPQNLIRSFESAAEPLLNHICASLQESHYLATTRDRLLPQLLSGGAPCTGAEE